ncbi:MAG: hypothetical protein AB3X45_09015, partial [Leptothrix ochracea]
ISFTAPTKLALSSSAALTASSNSGLAVTVTSTTPTICSVTAVGTAFTVFSGTRAGTCTLAANQAGNSAWKAATQVTAKISVK